MEQLPYTIFLENKSETETHLCEFFDIKKDSAPNWGLPLDVEMTSSTPGITIKGMLEQMRAQPFVSDKIEFFTESVIQKNLICRLHQTVDEKQVPHAKNIYCLDIAKYNFSADIKYYSPNCFIEIYLLPKTKLLIKLYPQNFR